MVAAAPSCPPALRQEVNLRAFTTWKVGGPAEWFAEPGDQAELIALAAWAHGQGLALRCIGAGSNLLIADAGVPGLTLCNRRLQGSRLEAQSGLVEAEAGEPIPFDTVRTARDGIAEVFYSVGTALNRDADPVYTLLHLRVALYLRPDHSDATLLTADVLQELKQYGLATETYATFGPEDTNFVSAEIGRAGSLRAQGNPDAAIETLQALARKHGNLISVQFALGDMMRMEERFVEAVDVYSAAISLLPKVTEDNWILFFYRGIAYEQSKESPSES